jgi:hypothetical protein
MQPNWSELTYEELLEAARLIMWSKIYINEWPWSRDDVDEYIDDLRHDYEEGYEEDIDDLKYMIKKEWLAVMIFGMKSNHNPKAVKAVEENESEDKESEDDELPF